MSNEANTKLIERAHEASNEWEGTPIAGVITALIKNNELDELRAMLHKLDTGEAFKEYQNEVRYA